MALSLPGLPPGQASLTGHASAVSQATAAGTFRLGDAITLTRAVGAAQAASQAAAASTTSTTSTATTISTAGSTGAHGTLTPDVIRAAASQRAPLVANASSPRSKRGLPAPPMTSAMLRADAAKQAMARKFLASKRHAAWARYLARKRHQSSEGHHARQGHHSRKGHRAWKGQLIPKGHLAPTGSPSRTDQARHGHKAGHGHQAGEGRLGKPGPKCARRACLTGLPAARSLAATQQPQVRNYWCGPATVSEMLRQVGVNVSQTKAASLLNTTSGGTDWSNARGYPVPSVLNANQKRNSYVAVALPWSPTAAQVRTYENDLLTDINHNGGAPIAGNAYEIPGGPHLAGHPPNQSISHWFDIRGYADSGATTKYEDSVHGATSIGWAAAVPAYSSLPSQTIVDILGARGYDW